MTSYYIGPEGPSDASLAIIAMKPGKDEHLSLLETGSGRPLIGASGKALDRHLYRIGTSRSATYLTNAVKHYDSYDSEPTTEEILKEQPALLRELSGLPNLKTVVALGDIAFQSLTNFAFARYDKQQNLTSDIMRRRGSIYHDVLGHTLVPTLHPSFYMHGEWRYQPVVEFDLKRAFQASQEPPVRPNRTFYIDPTFKEVLEWVQYLKAQKYISFDIETTRKPPHILLCIAFSDDPSRAFCIPIRKRGYQSFWDPDQELYIWRLIQDLLDQPGATYITQNGMFDCWHLWRHGFVTPHMSRGFDTMYAHRVLAPGMPHTLHFLVSIYTDPVENYYKDESGSEEFPADDRDFWVYNCKDSACTLEVAWNMMEDMEELGMLDYYQKWVQTQWDSWMEMQQLGFKVDHTRRIETQLKLQREKEVVDKRLKERVGWIPNVKSPKDMGKLLSDQGIVATRTPTGRPKMNEESLRQYAYNYPDAREVIVDVLDIVDRRTQLSGYFGMVTDPHGFYHAMYKLSFTVSGRSSSEGAEAGGPQLQNIPKPLRKMFIPDTPDHEITNIDQSQAEARIVAWDADDTLLIEAFLSGKKVHNIVGCFIYRGWNDFSHLPPDELTTSILKVCESCKAMGETECVHSEYYLSKRSNHAFSYRMGPRKFMTVLRKENIFISEAEAKRVRSCVVSPAKVAWQERAYSELKVTPWATNVYGRKREFYGLLDDEMVRELLSWKAQSAVADNNTRAQLFLHKALPKGSRILTQTHDSLTLCTLKKDKDKVLDLALEAFYNPMVFHGRELIIPIDVTHGPSWGEQI